MKVSFFFFSDLIASICLLLLITNSHELVQEDCINRRDITFQMSLH